MQVNGLPLVRLPEKRVHVLKVDMTRPQRAKYTRWLGAGRNIVRGFIAADTVMQNWAHVLQILTRYAPPIAPPIRCSVHELPVALLP
jgi:hypothetical protein